MFTEKEIMILNAGVEKSCKEIAKKVHWYVSFICNCWTEKGINPKTRLAEMASQEKWDSKSYGGDCLNKGETIFCGGLEESVFTNMFHQFGMGCNDFIDGSFIGCIILSRIMREDSEVDFFVRSVMQGAIKVNVVKHKLDYRNIYILETLESLID